MLHTVSTWEWIAYGLLLLTTLSLWIRPAVFTPGLLLSVCAAWAAGIVTMVGAAAVCVLLACCRAYASRSGHGRTALFWVCMVLALALGLHLVPGFRATLLAADVVLSPNSDAYTLRLSFDKSTAGVVLLRYFGPALLRAWPEVRTALVRTAPIAAITIVVLMGANLLVGYVAYEPKGSSLMWWWGLKNLFHTCISEEMFFRGILLQRLIELTARWRYSIPVSLLISSALFGAAHAGGGIQYVAISAVAGVGYGLAYVATRRIEMSILTHFLVNLVHIVFFTYPRSSGV